MNSTRTMGMVNGGGPATEWNPVIWAIVRSAINGHGIVVARRVIPSAGPGSVSNTMGCTLRGKATVWPHGLPKSWQNGFGVAGWGLGEK